ncbi:MAG: NUDIX hydrolase, partial [Pseudonocardia sp.]|nr:NUDIX hydrolase [Pseudonocardia sp.]
MSSPAEEFATPRVAAGALFVDGGRVLLVRKTYGNRWDIPGGYVDRGESPRAACRREVREEIGIEREPV